MIKKIKKIENLGIFSNYTWDSTLSDFKRYNIVYGWNACGKTTLSDLFNALGFGALEKFPDLKYKIDSESGILQQGKPYSRKVRVFNKDYITNNVQLLNCKAKHIYILGEENKEIADEIALDGKEAEKKQEQISKLEKNRKELENNRNKRFTDIARTISSNTSGEATRKYNKREAEAAFNHLSNKEILSSTDIQKHNLTLRQLEKPVIMELNQPKFIFRGSESNIENALKQINKATKNLCAKTVEVIIIERLKDNPDISNWVEDGIAIHNKHKSTICEFCNQTLPENRLSNLTKYFNEADKNLKDEIETLLGELKTVCSLINGIKPTDKANLYEEIQANYQLLVKKLEEEKKKVSEEIDKIAEVMKNKKTKTTSFVLLTLKTDATSLIKLIIQINNEIIKHNEKTNNFSTKKESAQKALEKHYLSTIYDEIKELDKNIQKIVGDVNKENEECSELNKKILAKKSKLSSSHKACETINESIKTFLGRDEITFEVKEDGYVIKRNGKIAKNLSEGEKTAIALVYFTVHLQDRDFNIKESILVIDDPVSSLDANSLFQAFAFLKNSVKNAKQIFMFTHNFDFLRLLLNWVKNIPKNKGEKGYFMILNKDAPSGRIAYISNLGKDLKEHESEYHFLFKILYKFKSDGTIASVYHVPNIARKMMETFLMFRVPSGESYYKKLESLKDKFDENKLTAIYKFTNDQSHITGKGLDPTLVLETQKNVKYLLEMINTTFPEHYAILESSIVEKQ